MGTLWRFKAVFDHPNYHGSASNRLLSLRQGNRSVADYSVDFWTYSADTHWNEEALRGVFIKGLCEQIRDELATRDEPVNLSSLVSLSIKIDKRLRERRQERAARSALPATSRFVLPTPARSNTRDPGSFLTTSSTSNHGKELMQLG